MVYSFFTILATIIGYCLLAAGPVLMVLSLVRKFRGDSPWGCYFGGLLPLAVWCIGSPYNYPTATFIIRIVCIVTAVGVFLINRFYTPKL